MKQTRIIGVIIAVLVSGLLAPGVAQAKQFESCTDLVSRYPDGVASSAKAAKRWQKRGYERPTVSRKVFRRNESIGEVSRGVLCGTTRTEARMQVAMRVARLIADSYPSDIRANLDLVAPGSPAYLWMEFTAGDIDARNWTEYGSRGVVSPPASSGCDLRPVRNRGASVGVRWACDGGEVVTFAFDEQDRVTDWQQPGDKALSERIRTVNGSTSVANVTVEALISFQSLDGQVYLLSRVRNDSAAPVTLWYTAVYGSSAGRLPAQASSGCVRPGQATYWSVGSSVPTEFPSPATWELEVMDGSTVTYFDGEPCFIGDKRAVVLSTTMM